MSTLPFSQHNAVSLRRLFPSASFVGATDIVAMDVVVDSRHCHPGCLFVAIPGTNVDGASFVEEAMANGAVAILSEHPNSEVDAPQCIVADARVAYSMVCQAVNRFPARRLDVVGVSGTNGKTTVTWLLRSILNAADRKTGLAGTIEFDDGEAVHPTQLTTADSLQFAEQLAAMVDNDCENAVVELSSHALAQSRVEGASLAAAVITNVTQDHFDYHGDFDSYCGSKAKIAELLTGGQPLVINADDEGCEILASQVPRNIDVQRFGIHCSADVRGTVLTSGQQGSCFEVCFADQRFEVTTRLVGEHNVSNCLAAICVALQMGVSVEAIRTGISRVRSIPGRLQRINLSQSFEVYVDYAHTPDALRRVLQSIRQFSTGRILCVVGAGGDRDQSKRPLLGEAASLADVVVLTSDNPRSEDADSIIQQMAAGVSSTCKTVVDADRQSAICHAIQSASAGDVVLIAGKGHETTQISGDDVQPFDDRIVARRAIAEVMSATVWSQKKSA